MFPFRDHNPPATTPYVVYGLIAANVIAYLATAGAGSEAFYVTFTLIPQLSYPQTFLTHQFLHGGLLHLGGNMLFLWIFGDNLEDRMGHGPFLVFYLASGVAAGIAQVMSAPYSPVPMVGASGAIAGVMGGYLLLFPRAKVDVLFIIVIIFKIVPIPAWIVLGAWFLIQVGSGAMTAAAGGGVAYWAHAGGFVAGLVLTAPLWLKLGGPAFWSRTLGYPPYPETQYRMRRTPVPRTGAERTPPKRPWGR